MELQRWCQDAGHPPVIAVGAFSKQQIPEDLYGMISALLLRGFAMGRDIQDQLNYQGFELPDREFYVGVQYHPEFKSRPNKPHPLFVGFVKAALDQQK